ncbi:MAG: hypothetical protein OEY27_07120, partial [Gammaproteobacteria bacterium]|nr:hypothetical protein [Gammaproteobacteria bacterium]
MTFLHRPSILLFALLLSACGNSGDGTSAPAGGSIIGTVPGTTIEALGDDGSYYAVESADNGTALHPFQLDVPSDLGFHLVMTTGKGTPDEVIIPVGFRDSANNIQTRFMLGAGDVVDLGHIPLPMSRNEAAGQDRDGDGVLDMPMVLDDVAHTNPLTQTHVMSASISDWQYSGGGYHLPPDVIDPQDVDGDGIPNVCDRKYTRSPDDSDGDGLPDDIDVNPKNKINENKSKDWKNCEDGQWYVERNHGVNNYGNNGWGNKFKKCKKPKPTPTSTPTPT